MVSRKIKKTFYNTLVICLLVLGLSYICSRFVHLGNAGTELDRYGKLLSRGACFPGGGCIYADSITSGS
jgi:hypothetical protein